MYLEGVVIGKPATSQRFDPPEFRKLGETGEAKNRPRLEEPNSLQT